MLERLGGFENRREATELFMAGTRRRRRPVGKRGGKGAAGAPVTSETVSDASRDHHGGGQASHFFALAPNGGNERPLA